MDKKLIIVISCVLFILTSGVGVYLGISNHTKINASEKALAEVSVDEQAYKDGIDYIDKKDYISACAKLKRFENMPTIPDSLVDAKYIYLFAQTQLYYTDGNKQSAFETIKKIPENYSGKYSDEIKILLNLLTESTKNLPGKSSAGKISESDAEIQLQMVDRDLENSDRDFDQKIALVEAQKNAARNIREEFSYSNAKYELEIQKLDYHISCYERKKSILQSTTFADEKIRLSQIDLQTNLIKLQGTLRTKILAGKDKNERLYIQAMQ